MNQKINQKMESKPKIEPNINQSIDQKIEPQKTIKRVLHRDWKALKLEYLTGQYRSLEQFAREKGINPTVVRYHAKGWDYERQILQAGDKIEQMNKHHNEVAVKLIERGKEYLKNHKITNITGALKAIELGVEIQREILLPKGQDTTIKVVFSPEYAQIIGQQQVVIRNIGTKEFKQINEQIDERIDEKDERVDEQINKQINERVDSKVDELLGDLINGYPTPQKRGEASSKRIITPNSEPKKSQSEVNENNNKNKEILNGM